MKKTYTTPETAVVATAQQLLYSGSLSTDRATFFQEDATGEAMTKDDRSGGIWDDDWSR